jgi:ppGpp synthetase/RelA/SpoT-type nucleotidyltranferase
MDKKMRKVTKKIKKAEGVLKKAEKENVRLANYDEHVRDPIIARAKKKGC